MSSFDCFQQSLGPKEDIFTVSVTTGIKIIEIMKNNCIQNKKNINRLI